MNLSWSFTPLNSFCHFLLISPTNFSVKSSEVQVNVSQNYYVSVFLLYLCSNAPLLLFCFSWLIIENCICRYVRRLKNFPFQCILINFANCRPGYNSLESEGLGLWFFFFHLKLVKPREVTDSVTTVFMKQTTIFQM